MFVTNDQPCTLVIGPTKIGYRETKPVDPEWEPRCEALAKVGALKVSGTDKPAPKSDKDQLIAMLAGLSQAERAELLGLAPQAVEAKPLGEATGPMTPETFASMHVASAKAFVRGCSDLDLLTQLSADEARPSVIEALSLRVKSLEESAAATAN